MRNVLRVGLRCGLTIAITGIAACTAQGSDSPNTAGTGGVALPPAGGMGGVGGLAGAPPIAGAGAGGIGGTPAPAGTGGAPPPAGSGGMAGAAGMSAGAGAGGMAGAAGMSGAGAGGAGEMPGVGEVSSAQCLMDVMASGTTVTACEMCLCQLGKCNKELTALKGDANGNALVKCSREKRCSGTCCICGVKDCGTFGENYGTGMCSNETETAAGVTPGAGALTNGAAVMMNCAATGPETSSCARAVRLGECSPMKCMAECMPAACM